MKILYLPIIDPSHHAVARKNKRGLYNALLRAGHQVAMIDYCDADVFSLPVMANDYKPDLLLSQFQGTNFVNDETATYFRTTHPNLKWVNFNQDYWPEHHTTPDMLALLRHVDLQLVSNGSVLPDYAANGVNAAYWPFAYETPVRPLPDVTHHDIVFLGNAYSDHRRKLGKLLKSLPYNVGLYGSGWEQADGDCNYDFTYGEALYKNAKIAISDNEFTDAVGYLSNRPFQILAAGGAVMLQQRVVQLHEYTGFLNGFHYIQWDNLDVLPQLINELLIDPDQPRLSEVIQDGQAFVREHHSYDVRVRELMAMVEGVRA